MCGKKLDIKKKVQIIILNKQGISNRIIGEKVGFNESTIRRFLKKYEETGEIGRQPGSGGKKITSIREDHFFKQQTLRNPFVTAPELKRELQESTGTIISTATVKRRLTEAGLFAFRTAKKPLLTKQMRKTRLRWAKEKQNWSSVDCQKVIFSDESKFNIGGSDGKTTVRRRIGERLKDACVAPRPKRTQGVMVWGSITSHGIGEMIIIKESINAPKYKKILFDGIIPTIDCLIEFESEIIFQDDSEPCHRAKSISILENLRKYFKNFVDVLIYFSILILFLQNK